ERTGAPLGEPGGAEPDARRAPLRTRAHAALPALRQGAASKDVVQAEGEVPGVRAAVGPGGGGLLPGRDHVQLRVLRARLPGRGGADRPLHLAGRAVGLPAVGRDRVHRDSPVPLLPLFAHHLACVGHPDQAGDGRGDGVAPRQPRRRVPQASRPV
ncbi:MAG: hypothetical protein AVDCRST_MAG89-3421, partial [uncultured Gemmatimonadetes bacterium]